MENRNKIDDGAWAHFAVMYLDDRRLSARTCWQRARDHANVNGLAWCSYRRCLKEMAERFTPEQLCLNRDPRRWKSRYGPRITMESVADVAKEKKKHLARLRLMCAKKKGKRACDEAFWQSITSRRALKDFKLVQTPAVGVTEAASARSNPTCIDGARSSATSRSRSERPTLPPEERTPLDWRPIQPGELPARTIRRLIRREGPVRLPAAMIASFEHLNRCSRRPMSAPGLRTLASALVGLADALCGSLEEHERAAESAACARHVRVRRASSSKDRCRPSRASLKKKAPIVSAT